MDNGRERDVNEVLKNCADFFYSNNKGIQNLQSSQQPQIATTNDQTRIFSSTSDEIVTANKETYVGQQISRYKIIRQLGEGSFGRVFLVRDLEWNRELALKVLSGGAKTNAIIIKKFYREAQAISQMKHPNIVNVYEVGKDGDNNFFTMDYIRGPSLADMLGNDKRINSRKAARIMVKIANAVHYAHQHNIIHRDIKPDNIMIDDSSEPFLTDFGLAKAIRGGTRLSMTGQISGTPAYMAPEQISGKNSEIDEKADIYGLGATLYEMITGQVPFPGNNTMDVLYRVANIRPTAPREINKNIAQDLEVIALKCLEKEKEKRYASALEVSQDLERYLGGVPVVANSKIAWIRKYMYILICSSFVLITSAFVTFIIYKNIELSKIKNEKQNALRSLEKIKQENQDALVKITHLQQDKQLALDKVDLLEQQKQKLIHKMQQQQKNSDPQKGLLENAIKLMGGNFGPMLKLKKIMWSLPYCIESGNLPQEADSPEKIDSLFQMVSVYSNESNLYLIWGKAYLLFYERSGANDHLITALDKFRTAIKMNPLEYEAVVLGYQNAFLLRDSQQAKSTIKEFVAYFPKEGQGVYHHLFKAYKHKIIAQESKDGGHYKESLSHLDKALQLQPTLEHAHIEKGVILRHIGQFEKAQKHILSSNFRSVLEMILLYLDEATQHPEDANSHIQKAKNWFDFAVKENEALTRIYLQKSQTFQDWKKKYPQDYRFFVTK